MTRKRSLSCYIRNEDSPLKTKNGEKNAVEKKEEEGGEGERKREGGRGETGTSSCARWDSTPYGVYFAVHPAAMRPACGEYKRGERGGGGTDRGRWIFSSGECGPRIAVRYK